MARGAEVEAASYYTHSRVGGHSHPQGPPAPAVLPGALPGRS